jgi:hypothetical protein
MKILSVTSEEFKDYGYKLDIDTSEIVTYLKKEAKMPEKNNIYVRDDVNMSFLKGIKKIQEEVYWFSDIEVGYCNGYNSLLNCLEYHMCPEVDIAGDDLVLLLARPCDIKNGVVDSKDVKAFLLKKGEAIVLNPYIMHFSPCKLKDEGFTCAIILSDKTNMDLPSKPSDPRLWKVNKYLFAHKDSSQASMGAYVGIVGENIKVDY